ncbi:MAG: hypothetical protein ACK504_11170 [Bacteroidota bacterium]
MSQNFPLFRKYFNNKNYFKILSENEFVEISLIGNKVLSKKHEAKIFPDKIFISDLIEALQHHVIKISKEEFSLMENQVNIRN